jgi:hypothetical protein
VFPVGPSPRFRLLQQRDIRLVVCAVGSMVGRRPSNHGAEVFPGQRGQQKAERSHLARRQAQLLTDLAKASRPIYRVREVARRRSGQVRGAIELIEHVPQFGLVTGIAPAR